MASRAKLTATKEEGTVRFELKHSLSSRTFSGAVDGLEIRQLQSDWGAFCRSGSWQSTNLDSPKSFGLRLAKEGLPAEVRTGLAAFLNESVGRTGICSICLDLAAQSAASLPWEILYLDEFRLQSEHVSLWPNVCLYRKAGSESTGGEAPDRPRVQIAYANPSTQLFPFLPHLESEVLSLSERILEARRRVDVQRLANAGPATLRQAIRSFRPHVFHFVGHARRTPTGGEIVLQGGWGEEYVSAAELAEWLVGAGTRHAFLSACDSAGQPNGIAETLVQEGLPVAIGFQSSVQDEVQRAFVEEYYRELLSGKTVESALSWSRHARRSDPGWWMPVLVTSSPTVKVVPSEPIESMPEHPTDNLPLFDERFIGRSADLSALQAVLLREGHGLVCLTGVGGIGKTRLAIQFASVVANEFLEGVWLIPCDRLTTMEQVLAAIAATLKLRVGGDGLLASVSAELGEWRALLVLDNVDKLAGSGIGAAFSKLLESCPNLKVVATSRAAPAGFPGVDLLLGPMTLPPEGEATSDSVDYFLESAQRADRSFQVTKQDLRIVADICRKVEGIPLALQITAARVPYLSLAELRDRVDKESAETINVDPAVKQQASLRRILEATLDRLAHEDLEVLYRLSVFQGGFFLKDAVGALQLSETDLVNALVRLKSTSLIHTTRVDGAPRYRILDAIRACLESKVTDRSLLYRREDDRIRHAEVFATRLKNRHGATETGMDREAWLWLEIANIRTAAEFCFKGDQLQTGAVFAENLLLPFFDSGMWEDFAEVAKAGHRIALETGAVTLEMELLGLEGALAARQKEYDRCTDLWGRRLKLAAETGHHAIEADARLDLACQAFTAKRLDETESMARDALPAALAGGRPDLLATVYLLQAQVAVERGEFDSAERIVSEAERIAEEAVETNAMLYVRTSIGGVRLACGNFLVAENAYRQTISLAYRRSRLFHVQGALLGLSRVYVAVDECERAGLCLIAANKLRDRIPSSRRKVVEQELDALRTRLAGRAASAVFIESEPESWTRLVGRILSQPLLEPSESTA